MSEFESMTNIQPELWVEGASAAVDFYQTAFDAVVIHRVGHGTTSWLSWRSEPPSSGVAVANSNMQRLSPRAIGRTTGRTLLVVDDPDAVLDQAVSAGATEIVPVGEEHGWRIGRIVDPFGHEWEIGRSLGVWPPQENGPTQSQ